MTGKRFLRAISAFAFAFAAFGAGLHVAAPTVEATDDPLCASNKAACGTVIVSLSGYGTGLYSTTSSLNGAPDGRISCGIQYGQITGTCRATFFVGTLPGQTRTIYVHVEADANSKPDGSGTLTLHAGETLRPSQDFEYLHATFVWVHLDGLGSGSVTSDPPNINCPAGTCTWGWSDEVVTFTAVAAPGSVFVKWGEDCAAFTGPACALMVTGPATIYPRAYFAPIAVPSPSPSPTPRPSASPSPQTPAPSRTTVPTRTPAASGSPSASVRPTPTDAASSSAASDAAPTPTGGPPTPVSSDGSPRASIAASAELGGAPSDGPEAAPSAGASGASMVVVLGIAAAGLAVLAVLLLARRFGRRSIDTS